MRRLSTFAFCLALTAGTGLLGAAQFAVLIGISDYAAGHGKFHLDGPQYDVPALKQVLVRRYSMPASNIDVLLNSDATKTRILSTLERRVLASQPGDSLFIYFSGHGTSAFDGGMLEVSSLIGPNSGALVPYDWNTDSAEKAGDSMIIGHRDLRPILSRLHPRAAAWVVFDSCYSENSVRSLSPGWEGPARAINLVSAIQPVSGTNDSRRTAEFGNGDTTKPEFGGQENTPDAVYPYSNVVSFSAASRDETARDISQEMLNAGRAKTLDGLPHGAFTSGLLQALSGAADTNHDGKTTYDELFRSTRELVEASSKQRPQILPRKGTALEQVVLRAPALPNPETAPSIVPAPQGQSTHIALDGVSEPLRQAVSTLVGVQVSTAQFDLALKQRGSALTLYDGSLRPIREYTLAETRDLLSRIAAEGDVQRLATYAFAAQDFNLTVDVDPTDAQGHPQPGLRGTFSIGETLSISASIEKPAYLLVFDVDKSGVLTVLYPGPNDPEPFLQRISSEIVSARVGAPAGTETVKAFAFVSKPPGFDSFACKAAGTGSQCPEIRPGDTQFHKLLEMLASGTRGRSEAHTKILTQ